MSGAAARVPPALMLQGTGSNVGKSLLVAGLCRAFAARGLAVRPFKPQNMSNNAAVTADGREIGRAQALQARAAGVEPCADMNPVLLKPESEHGAQVVVQGAVAGTADARRYRTLKAALMPPVLESFARLGAERGPDSGGRGGQPGRGEPARKRHRQYGLRQRRRGAGGASRRCRPGRRDREPCRHLGVAAGGRARA